MNVGRGVWELVRERGGADTLSVLRSLLSEHLGAGSVGFLRRFGAGNYGWLGLECGIDGRRKDLLDCWCR